MARTPNTERRRGGEKERENADHDHSERTVRLAGNDILPFFKITVLHLVCRP